MTADPGDIWEALQEPPEELQEVDPTLLILAYYEECARLLRDTEGMRADDLDDDQREARRALFAPSGREPRPEGSCVPDNPGAHSLSWATMAGIGEQMGIDPIAALRG